MAVKGTTWLLASASGLSLALALPGHLAAGAANAGPAAPARGAARGRGRYQVGRSYLIAQRFPW